MEKYTNERGKECYRGVDYSTAFSEDLFHAVEMGQNADDYQVAFHSNLGSITVLDRLTGFSGGIRDIETGYRDMTGNFWLASGMQDVRDASVQTVGEAIAWIKSHANTCIGDERVGA